MITYSTKYKLSKRRHFANFKATTMVEAGNRAVASVGAESIAELLSQMQKLISLALK